MTPPRRSASTLLHDAPTRLEVEGPSEPDDPAMPTCRGDVVLECPRCGIERSTAFACAVRCGRCPWREDDLLLGMTWLPRVPMRHWTIELPSPWRGELLRDARGLSRFRAVALREVFHALRHHGPPSTLQRDDLHGGAAAAFHVLGPVADPRLQLHAIVLDGVYRFATPSEFVSLGDEPSAHLLRGLGHRLEIRLRELARLHGWLPGMAFGSLPAPPWLRVHANPPGERVRVEAGPRIPAEHRRTLREAVQRLARPERDDGLTDFVRPRATALDRAVLGPRTLIEGDASLARWAARARLSLHGVLARNSLGRSLLGGEITAGSTAPEGPSLMCPRCRGSMRLVGARKQPSVAA